MWVICEWKEPGGLWQNRGTRYPERVVEKGKKRERGRKEIKIIKEKIDEERKEKRKEKKKRKKRIGKREEKKKEKKIKNRKEKKNSKGKEKKE